MRAARTLLLALSLAAAGCGDDSGADSKSAGPPKDPIELTAPADQTVETDQDSIVIEGRSRLPVVQIINVGGPSGVEHADDGGAGFPEYRVAVRDGRFSQRVVVFPGVNSIIVQDTARGFATDRAVIGTATKSPPVKRQKLGRKTVDAEKDLYDSSAAVSLITAHRGAAAYCVRVLEARLGKAEPPDERMKRARNMMVLIAYQLAEHLPDLEVDGSPLAAYLRKQADGYRDCDDVLASSLADAAETAEP